MASHSGPMAEIRHAISIAATPQKVYRLVAAGRGFARWWAADVTELPDEKVELRFFKRTTIYRLSPIRMVPPSEALWVCDTGKEWEGTRLRFQLEPVGSNTQVRFTHAGWAAESDYFFSCNTTWGALMFRLKAAGEGKAVAPLFLSDGMAY